MGKGDLILQNNVIAQAGKGQRAMRDSGSWSDSMSRRHSPSASIPHCPPGAATPKWQSNLDSCGHMLSGLTSTFWLPSSTPTDEPTEKGPREGPWWQHPAVGTDSWGGMDTLYVSFNLCGVRGRHC